MRACALYMGAMTNVGTPGLLTILFESIGNTNTNTCFNKKLSYCWETVQRESMPRIAEMDVEMTT